MKNNFKFKMLIIRTKSISPLKFRTKYLKNIFEKNMLSQAMFTHFNKAYFYTKMILSVSLFIVADLVN